MVILDTHVILGFLKGSIIERNVFFTGEQYAICSRSYLEIMKYPFKCKDEENLIKNLLNKMVLLNPNQDICNQAIRLVDDHKISKGDAIIAATAVYYGAVLMSLEKKLIKIPGIEIFDVNRRTPIYYWEYE